MIASLVRLVEFLKQLLKLEKSKLTVLGNHWPSQGNPDKFRYVAAKKMAKIAKYARYPLVATGDFNTVDSDNPHGINDYVINRARKTWFYDAERVFFGDDLPFNTLIVELTTTAVKWSSLDKIFVLAGSLGKGCGNRTRNCVTPLWDTYKVVKEDFMLKDVTFTNSSGRRRHL